MIPLPPQLKNAELLVNTTEAYRQALADYRQAEGTYKVNQQVLENVKAWDATGFANEVKQSWNQMEASKAALNAITDQLLSLCNNMDKQSAYYAENACIVNQIRAAAAMWQPLPNSISFRPRVSI